MKIAVLGMALLCCGAFAGHAHADALGQGVERVIVDDGLPLYCVNALEDHLSVRVQRVVVDKSKGWFSNDKAVDIVMGGKISKRNDLYEKSAVEMPVVFRANIKDYISGTVATPVDLSLVHNHPLALGGHVVNLVEIDFSFVNSSEPTILTRVLANLPNATRGLPIPPSPYTESFIEATEVLGNIINSVMGDDENDDDVSHEGRISLEFNETGKCGRNGTYAGTYLFVKSYGGSGDGIVSLNELHEYCFFMDSSKTSVVYIERKSIKEDGKCTFDPRNGARLVNPHFVILISIVNEFEETERQRLESDMALALQEQADGQPQKVASVDGQALSWVYSEFGFDWKATSDFAQGDELGHFYATFDAAGGDIKYIADQATPPVALWHEWFNEGGKLDEEPTLIEVVSGADIVLNTLARCAAHGLDVFECP